jgi:TPP-dependent pyruvate/acetoin dehydrogenase alpha subunit
MGSEVVDGMDVVAVEAAALRAAHAVRRGEGPRFLEAKTYRFRAHSMFDPDLYRDKTEVEEWKKHGPIVRFTKWVLGTGLAHAGDVEALEAEIAREIEAAVAFAEAAPWEPVEDLTRDVYTLADARAAA